MAKYFLTTSGCEVQALENRLQAVEHIHLAASQGVSFGLVLMDVQMPTLNGESALTRLRFDYATLPMIGLTSDAMKGTL